VSEQFTKEEIRRLLTDEREVRQILTDQQTNLQERLLMHSDIVTQATLLAVDNELVMVNNIIAKLWRMLVNNNHTPHSG